MHDATISRIRLRSVFLMAALLLVGACGDADSGTLQPSAPTSVSVTTIAPSDDGDRIAPVAAPGEFGELPEVTMTGRVLVTRDGCWLLRGGGESALLVAPAGTALRDDGISLVTPAGTVVADGTDVDAVAALVALDELPGGPDGRWAEYASRCRRSYPYVVVAASIAPAFEAADIDPAELAATLDAAIFDTDYPCGFGFTTGDAAGRWRLQIDPVDWPPPEPGPISLPDDRLRATVTAGAHLFVNHCDDVSEWFEPDAVRAVSWPVTSGEFVYPAASTEICAGQPPQTITLVGAIVETDIGSVALDPIEITNTAFGCVAG